jgi:predicted PurR-regulated permease PerM
MKWPASSGPFFWSRRFELEDPLSEVRREIPMSYLRNVKSPVKANASEELIFLLSIAAKMIIAVVIISTIYFGREIFVPLALSILLSFVLAPLVELLQRIQIPRGLAVVSVVVIAFGLLFAIGGLLATQTSQLAGDLPRYQSTISDKIHVFRDTAAGRGTLERASGMLKQLSKELDKPDISSSAAAPKQLPDSKLSPQTVPVPVEVRQPDPGALENLRSFISPLLHPLATTGITVIFVIFILLQREDLRNRLIRLAGSHDIQRTTSAIDDGARRLSRLFLTQLIVNGAFGVVIGLGLWWIGIPGAVVWGILAAVLRFVPYLGAVIAAAFPLVFAVAVDPGWSMLVWTAVLFIIVEPIVGHIIEPMVYGHTTGLSPVAVVVSATFWTAVWGPIGLVLSTPLTVCLVVLGRHVERLEFLDVMFGDRPALTPPEIFYQRMLANDPSEAAEKAEEVLKERSLVSYYDEVAIKGLQLAQTDFDRGALNIERLAAICETVTELTADLSDNDDRTALNETITSDPEASSAVESVDQERSHQKLPVLSKDALKPEWQSEAPILCVAGQSPLDEAAARMCVQLSDLHGLSARIEAADALSTSNLFRLQTNGVRMVCLIYMNASATAHMRYAVRRIRRKFPQSLILLGCLSADIEALRLNEFRDGAKADLIAASLGDIIELAIEAAVIGNEIKDSEIARTLPDLHILHAQR